MFGIRLGACVGLAALVLGTQSPALASGGPSAPQKLVIGVDHVDAANQNESAHRWFEYTDFFSRDVSVHRGEVLDFRFAAGEQGHAIALAPGQAVARQVYPLATPDSDDPPSVASGKSKLALGPSNFVITGGSTQGGGQIGSDPSGGDRPCGVMPLPDCTFNGGNDIEASGPIVGSDASDNPETIDWRIQIDPKTPTGSYAFLCFFHPGMQGRFQVVDKDDRSSNQATVDAISNVQFQVDRALAVAAEAQANVLRFDGGSPGNRTYHVTVGTTTADDHASVLEMLPQHLDLVEGDKVSYSWRQATNEAHSVSFPSDGANLPGVAVFDCGTSFQVIGSGPPCTDDGAAPEVIFDPGTSPPGSPLTSAAALVDSGILVGSAYNFPSAQTWSVSTNGTTATGTYQYHCQIHDLMQGTLNVHH